MADAKRTILVTGFEPFGGETVNASWEAARQLDGWRGDDAVAVARRLPCTYRGSAEELIRTIETLKPDAILMTGQAARRSLASVERFARNLDDASTPDNTGVVRKWVRISADGPERLETPVRVPAIAEAIKTSGIRGRVSRNAGGFVCNHLYFCALEYLRKMALATPAVFVHVPATPAQAKERGTDRGLETAESVEALKVFARVLVGQRPKGG